MNHNRTVGLFVLYGLFASASAIGQQVSDDNSAEISIEAQRLDLALNELAQQSGFQLLTFSEDALDKTAKSLNGILSDEQALDLLLEGTGLTYREVEEDVIAVGSPERLSAKFPGNSRPASNPTLVAQSRISAENRKPPTRVPANANSSMNDYNATSVVTGRVTDARTGANLKGAKVTIEETGQWTSTGDLGRFRFASVPNGSVTLTVSYLGYAGQSAVIGVQGAPTSQDFALRSGDGIDEIVVIGTRSARAIALNLERTAENSQTVISSDLLGNFTGTTISESLRRAPGIAFEQDIDTGDGTNVIIRGLAPDLNVVKFNGIELPEGSGEGRSANLGNILSDSIQSVTISQTLLANQDSGGTGGLVEIETKSALDRDARFVQFSIESRQRDDDFLDDEVYGAIVSGKFGASENFGLGAAVQFRDREIRSVTGDTAYFYGAYLPLDSLGGTSIRDENSVLPGNPFPFFDTPGAAAVYPTSIASSDSLTSSETTSYSLNAAYDWADHTTLRFDYQRLEDDRRTIRSGYRLFAGASTTVRPVADRGGEELRALTDQFGHRPIISINASENFSDIVTDIYTVRGASTIGRFTFDYIAGYTSGETERPVSPTFTFSTSAAALAWDDDAFIDRSAVDPVEGIVLAPFAPANQRDDNAPIPLFTPAGFAAVNDPASFSRLRADLGQRYGSNDRFSVEFSGRYDFDQDFLKYLELGVDFEESEFESFQFSSGRITPGSEYTSLASLGTSFDTPFLGGIRRDIGVQTLSKNAVNSIFRSLANYAANDVLIVGEPEAVDQGFNVRAIEQEIAPFVQARFDVGDIEIIGGFRYSIVEIEADDADFPRLITEVGLDNDFAERFTEFRTESTTQRALLPRFIVNYRPTDNIVVRGGYSKAIARPQLRLLSDARTFTFDVRPFLRDIGPARLSINEGNEDLEPAETDSFDLAFEYYRGNASAYKVAIFWKVISNITELNSFDSVSFLDGVTLPPYETESADFQAAFPDGFDILAQVEAGNVEVRRNAPFNNESDAVVRGVQLSAEQQFTFLPDWWSGFGYYANYTYTDSEKDQPLRIFEAGEPKQFVIEDVRFNGDPRHSGTGAITYNEYGIDAALIYSFQDRRQTRFIQNGFSEYEEALETLDFRFAYNFDQFDVFENLQLVFEATDLLRDADEPASIRSEGEDFVYFTNRSYRGGREFRLGLTATF